MHAQPNGDGGNIYLLILCYNRNIKISWLSIVYEYVVFLPMRRNIQYLIISPDQPKRKKFDKQSLAHSVNNVFIMYDLSRSALGVWVVYLFANIFLKGIDDTKVLYRFVSLIRLIWKITKGRNKKGDEHQRISWSERVSLKDWNWRQYCDLY